MVLRPPPQQTAAAPNQSAPFAAPPQTPSQQPGGCCDCSLPPDASSDVKSTRATTIAVIAVHALALAILGFYNLWQWIASLMTIISGSVLLCQFTKCAYTTAAILYTIGFIFDVLAAIAWLTTDFAAVAILPAVGAVTLVAGAVFTFKVVCHWDKSPAPAVATAHAVPNASYPAPSFPAGVHQQHPQAHKGPPPTYDGTV